MTPTQTFLSAVLLVALILGVAAFNAWAGILLMWAVIIFCVVGWFLTALGLFEDR